MGFVNDRPTHCRIACRRGCVIIHDSTAIHRLGEGDDIAGTASESWSLILGLGILVVVKPNGL